MIIKPRFFPTTAVAFTEQTQSLSLNEVIGTEEALANLTAQSISIANIWTTAVWFKPLARVFTTGDQDYLIQVSTDAETDTFEISYFGSIVGDPLGVAIFRTDGTLIKDYRWVSVMTQDVWMFFAFTWDGTTLNAYIDGTLTAPTSIITDLTGSVADANRKVSLGNNRGLTQGGNIRLHSVGLWDSVLTAAEVTALYNAGDGSTVNWGTNSGNYVSSADLQHWWRVALDTTSITTMGQDYGISSNLINVGTNALNITAADDVVTDAP